MRTGVAATLLGVALAACGSAVPDSDGAATPAAASAEATPGSDEVAPSPLSAADPAVRDAVLLTAIDEVLAGTRFADLVEEDPGAFLETADTLCSALEDDDADAVLGAFLNTLRDEGLDLDEDTAYLGGALFGAAVTVRCPQHDAALTEVSP